MKNLTVALLFVLSLAGLLTATRAQADLRPRIEPRMRAPEALPGSDGPGLWADKDRDRQRREREQEKERERQKERERREKERNRDRRRGSDREEGEEELQRALPRVAGLSAAQVAALEQVDPGAFEDLLRLRAAAHGLGGR